MAENSKAKEWKQNKMQPFSILFSCFVHSIFDFQSSDVRFVDGKFKIL